MIPFRTCLLAAAITAAGTISASAAERCFGYETETAGALLILDLPDGDGPVTGVEHGGVQDEKQGYYTSWENRITGTRTGNVLDLTVEIAIEEDRRTEKQVWRIEGDAIVNDRDRFLPESCEEAQDAGFDNVPDHASDDITRGHCLDSEDVLFTCEINDDDVLSICAATDRSTLSYRYGPVVAPELEFPKDPAGSVKKFMFHTIGYAGGYDTRIAFKTGPYTYVVHEQMISRGPSDPEKDVSAGVTLYENGKERTALACRSLGEAGLGLNQLYDVVPQKAFFDEEGLVQE